MAPAYTTCFLPVRALDHAMRKRMARLYLANYDGSDEALFFGDLTRKDEVLLVQAGKRRTTSTITKARRRAAC